jgi:hypothetical protein
VEQSPETFKKVQPDKENDEKDEENKENKESLFKPNARPTQSSVECHFGLEATTKRESKKLFTFSQNMREAPRRTLKSRAKRHRYSTT